MTERWTDRCSDALLDFVDWPLVCAQGRHWTIRVLALTCGWIWMIPAFLVAALVEIVVLFPVDEWQDLRGR